MNNAIQFNVVKDAATKLRKHWPFLRPKCGVVLGSGWDNVVKSLGGDTLSYNEIAGLGQTTVDGHSGKICRVMFDETEVLIFQGRHHYYEGLGWTPVVFPVLLLHLLGADTVLLTNAAGGIREDLKPGTLMVITDHINQMGTNPLIGPHQPELGVRFPDQTEVYSKELRKILLQGGADAIGTYVGVSGPPFETPAEIWAYQSLGAHAVGMSTVPEAIVANALGMKVAGLSCICNWAAGIGDKKLNHELVNMVAEENMPRMEEMIKHFITAL